jgi:hypothetical protein
MDVRVNQPHQHGGFRVNGIISDGMAARKQRLDARLDKHNFPDDCSQPMLRGGNVHYELSGRAIGTVHGGIGVIQQMVREIGLAEAIDQRVCFFKRYLPYHESDHVLNLAYNALCAATCLEDLELRRQDEGYLNLLGAERIPDPTTAGDFCRRFERHHLDALQEAYDVARRKVWSQQPPEFFAEARIEADGTMVETDAECKQGIDYSHKGVWGYHPLLITLANTGEVLRLLNRSGSRPSHEGAAPLLDQCIALCRGAGFKKIVLRGDTDFSQTKHLDRWHAQGDVQFVFGFDVTPYRYIDADDLPASSWKPLTRPPKYEAKGRPRSRPERYKQKIVEERRFKDVQLVNERVAEMPYRPAACRNTYRLVIVRKNLDVRDPQQGRFLADYRYLFYLTNDWKSTPTEIVHSANDRCQQENLIAQLGAVRALHAPVDNLLSNEAYMLMTALAWNLKAWLALMLPEPAVEQKPPQSPSKRICSKKKQRRSPSDKQRVLGLEFRTFVNYFVRIPAQIVNTGRRLVVRLMAYNRWQPVFFTLVTKLARPHRC